MKTMRILAFCLLPCLLGSAGLLMLAGCEGSSSDDVSGADRYFDSNPYASEARDDYPSVLYLEPKSYLVTYVGQTVAFSVSGGEGNYHWSLSFDGNGSINPMGANQAVYNVRRVAPNSVTVQDEAGHFGVAYIQTASSTNAVNLAISPPSVTLADGQRYASFTASGGTAPYAWISGNTQLGTISYAAGASHVASYTAVAGAAGQNVITVVDAAGLTASATVIHDKYSAMTISPASVSLTAGQLYASFTVSGGTAPYTWTSGNVRLGTVSYSAGSSYVASYTAVSGAYGENQVTVRDATGLTASASVSQKQQ